MLFPVVGVGASAGGLEAFTQLLSALPSDTGMAFVLVQHLDPEHESALVQLLSRSSSLPVREVGHDEPVRPDHVYVIPRDTVLTIAGDVLKLRPRERSRRPQRSIDTFFESLAAERRERAIGVVLSGTASDGTLGLEAIKAEGGITFAQDESAKHDSMPRSAIAAGCVDAVLSPKEIAAELARIARHPYVAGAVPDVHEESSEDDQDGEADRGEATEHAQDSTPLPSGGRVTGGRAPLQRGARAEGRAADGYRKIVFLLRSHSGVDFTLYKSNTIRRRINRRLIVTKQESLAEYAAFLQGNAKELDALYSDVLISVTSFFRNPETFEFLQREVLPRMLKEPGDEPVRCWVLGCSTGQEAYSIAMAFVEAADKAPHPRRLQVFATDLNDALLDKARNGLYAKSLIEDVAPERLRRFFVEEDGGYRVVKSLRDMVVFARQNFIADPPFSRMNLVSCRNLLIYIEPGLQAKAMPMFHYALKPGGVLMLGASESIGGFGDLFEQVDRKHRVYTRKPGPALALHLPARRERGEPAGRTPQVPGKPEPLPGFHGELSDQREADRITLSQFAPPGVLVNVALQVVQFRGPTGPYLQPPQGKASFDVLKMARPGLMLPLRAAIEKAGKDGKPARRENVRIQGDGTGHMVNLLVVPVGNPRERSFLILFEDTRGARRGAARTEERSSRPLSNKERAGRIAELEIELTETREYLQSKVEQQEASNEELQAATEEVQSANEELQSVNEELETSKEELESTNEELNTLNEEISHRNAELTRANSDLLNLQNSTKVGIVLLGRDLAIRRFSSHAEKQLGLRATDVGRPIGHLQLNLYTLGVGERVPFDPARVAAAVVDEVREQEHEVCDKDGRWQSLRVRPYMTLDNKVDGAVVVVSDIDTLKRTEQAVGRERDFARATIETVREPLLVLDGDLRVESANRAFFTTFRVQPTETIGRLVFDLGNHQWDIARLRELLTAIVPQDSTVEDYEVEHDFETIGTRNMLLNARRIDNPDAGHGRILLAIEDVTERRRAEQSLARLAEIVASSDDAIISKDTDGVIKTWNRGAERLFGYAAAEMIGRPVALLIPADRADEEPEILRRIRRGETIDHYETVRQRKDGTLVDISLTVSPIRNAAGEVVGASKVARDITETKQAERALREADRRKDEFLAMLGHELRNPLAPICTALDFMREMKIEDGNLRKCVEMIERQSGHMVRLVDDLLEMSRIATGKLRIETADTTLGECIERAVEAAQPLIDARGHRLIVEQPPQPIQVHGDSVRLTQVFTNLLTNAARYSAPGKEIRISLRAGEGGAVVTVADEGEGISPERLGKVFEPFSQGGGGWRTGLGVGLPLARRLAELHGGTLEGESAGVGKGSTFTVTLPLDERPASSVESTGEPAAGSDLTGCRVLVVDDNADAAQMLQAYLDTLGCEVHCAYDGASALSLARELDPEVILLDIGLPDLDGYEVLRRLRAGSSRAAAIALTGLAQPADLARMKEAGFDLSLRKPATTATLAAAIASVRRKPV